MRRRPQVKLYNIGPRKLKGFPLPVSKPSSQSRHVTKSRGLQNGFAVLFGVSVSFGPKQIKGDPLLGPPKRPRSGFGARFPCKPQAETCALRAAFCSRVPNSDGLRDEVSPEVLAQLGTWPESEGAFAHMAVGQNPNRLAPSEHPNPTTKIGSKMGGEFTYPKMVPLVLTHSHMAVAHKAGIPKWLARSISGNMDQHLRNPSFVILSHTHIS